MTTLRTLLTGASAVIALGLAGAAFAQSANDSANVSVNLVRPITVTKSADLDFGDAKASTSGYTITIDQDGGRASSVPGNLLSSNDGTVSQFDVTAIPTQVVGIVATVNPAASGTQGVTLGSLKAKGCGLTAGATLSTTATTVTIPTAACSINVGGTLTVPANAGGSITVGTLNVALTYN